MFTVKEKIFFKMWIAAKVEETVQENSFNHCAAIELLAEQKHSRWANERWDLVRQRRSTSLVSRVQILTNNLLKSF